MECSLPPPAIRLVRGETSIFMPVPVEEFVRAVRQVAPGQRGDGIDHMPQRFLGLFALSNVPSHAVNSSSIRRGVPRYPVIGTVLGPQAVFKAQRFVSVGEAFKFGSGSFL